MTQFVITPQNGDKVIFGVVEATTEHEASMMLLRAVDVALNDVQLASDIFFHKAKDEAVKVDTYVDPAMRLKGHGWFELAPSEPLPGGQPGGDRQIGDAWARRFAMRVEGDLWAVQTVSIYVALTIDDPNVMVLEREDEYTLCTDLHDVTGTEVWGHTTYTGLPYEPSGHNARREAFLVFAGNIAWDGTEFDGAKIPELV
jgi:hypothetical protein